MSFLKSSLEKSQASLEFLMIFGIGFFIVMILGGIFFSYFNEGRSKLNSEHLQNIGTSMIEHIEKVYFLGNNNRLSVKFNFPDNVVNMSIHHKKNEVNGVNVSFDYLNISYMAGGDIQDMILTTKEPYIRFNCSKQESCHHDLINNISYYNATYNYAQGVKTLQFESYSDYVAMDFVSD